MTAFFSLRTASAFLALGLLGVSSLPARADQEAIAALLAVGPEGAGNAAASEASQTLNKAEPETILPLLTAMADASPISRNWLRAAVEALYNEHRDSDGALPASELQAFVVDRENHPMARDLAFDLFRKLDQDAAVAMIPAMATDPSPVLRREAVAQLVETGANLI
ncbi:MAG: hypothetical protein AAF236_14925, partial [Verrucomicrobiota bacterium]